MYYRSIYVLFLNRITSHPTPPSTVQTLSILSGRPTFGTVFSYEVKTPS